MSRTDLTKAQWTKLEPLLPPNLKRGHAYQPYLPVINGILWQIKTGAPWRDLPERYAPWQTCWDRLTRWSRQGIWHKILGVLQAEKEEQGKIDWFGASLDSASVHAHRSAVGAQKQRARPEKRGASKTSGSASVAVDARPKSTS